MNTFRILIFKKFVTYKSIFYELSYKSSIFDLLMQNLSWQNKTITPTATTIVNVKDVIKALLVSGIFKIYFFISQNKFDYMLVPLAHM